MLPYTGDYIKHNNSKESDFAYFTFIPRPLMKGGLFKLDDELAALLIDALHGLGLLEGLINFASNKSAFSELMILKECVYSRLIDYGGLFFHEVLISRGSRKALLIRLQILNCHIRQQRIR